VCVCVCVCVCVYFLRTPQQSRQIPGGLERGWVGLEGGWVGRWLVGLGVVCSTKWMDAS